MNSHTKEIWKLSHHFLWRYRGYHFDHRKIYKGISSSRSMENKEIEQKKTVKCNFCNYIWETSSQKQFVTCPDCLNKVNIEENSCKDKEVLK